MLSGGKLLQKLATGSPYSKYVTLDLCAIEHILENPEPDPFPSLR